MWLSSQLFRRVIWYKLIDVSEVLAASIITAMSDISLHHSFFYVKSC
jgi:hypothetical protein